MIADDMIVSWDRKLARDLNTGDYVDVLPTGMATIELLPIVVLGAPVFHMCQKITTPSGCVAICSNNALVLIDDPSREGRGTVNCQRIGLFRIAVLYDGLLMFEPAIAEPFTVVPVAQLIVPNGAIAAGQAVNRRILFTLPR